MKKILALVMALTMIFALTAVSASADDAIVLKIGVSTADTDPRNIAAKSFADEIEEKIHELEGKIADIEEQMSDPERAADFEWMQEQSRLMAECEEEISSLYDEWMELQ